MPIGTIEEFLHVVSQNKRPQFCEILSHHRYTPGQKNGSLNKTSRLGSRMEPKLTPYKEVLHVLRRNVLFGVSYENMVNNQRVREAESALAELVADLPSFVKLTTEVEPFIAGSLFGGYGVRDEMYPKLAARHSVTGQRYLVFWPASDKDGKLIPNESRYFDENDRELDFKVDLEEYWRKFSKSKVQGTEREVHWSTVKFENVVQIKAGKQVWNFEYPVIRALA